MRAIYDKKLMETLSIGMVSMEHKDWPDEKKVAVGKSKEALNQMYMIQMASDLKIKIRSEYIGKRSNKEHSDHAKRILCNIQPELIKNINEWIDGSPISDVKVHGVSVPDIMHLYGGEEKTIHFLNALECMIAWKETGYEDPNYYKRYFSCS